MNIRQSIDRDTIVQLYFIRCKFSRIWVDPDTYIICSHAAVVLVAKLPLIFSTDLTDQFHDVSSDGIVGRSLTEQ